MLRKLKNYIEHYIHINYTIPKQRKEKFEDEFKKFKENENDQTRFELNWEDCKPCLHDNTDATDFNAHYLYHQAWAARILAKNRPSKHTDISSSVFFLATVSAFIPINFYDIRPPKINLSNVRTGQANLVNLPFDSNSIESLSCMHTLEHVGLGRYGDEIDYNGDLKAMNELQRVLKTGGDLIIVVPIGCKAKIEFNAHRIYKYKMLEEYFSKLSLKEFSFISQTKKKIYNNCHPSVIGNEKYGCGCFWFKK